MKELIRKLVETYGPSGSEERIRDTIKSEIEGLVDEVRVDPLGNLIAHKTGSGARVLIAAHMDEIGVIVTFIDDNGFLRFSNVGGVRPHVLLGSRVIFKNGTIGTFGTERLDDIKDLRFDKMFIDIGAKDRKSAEAKVSIGDTAGYHREFTDLGDRLLSKSMDDRIGCAVAVEAMRRLKGVKLPNDVYFAFTAQEEVGARGARTVAYGVSPDMGIALDVTGTGDTPESLKMAVKLGGGAAIKAMDRSIMVHPKVKDFLVDVAKQANIPYQIEILEYGGTDAGSIHTTKEGVPSGVISIPARYIHTPNEIVDYQDVENSVKLLVEALKRPVEKVL
ncbi:MAG TPA: M42 family metallopeptidase [Firmicutes bacterium]|nr:M42 family metallopeptidase [Bacillota bacterium]HHY99417.1 M42 family metallopeptidase [Bacillota bacterium]